MPTPFDLLSQKLDDPDPEDDLQMLLGQDQGANLAGGPEAKPDAQPDLAPPGASGMPQPVAPSPNVAGPLAALVKKIKPKIRLLPKKTIKPHIKLKSHPASAPPPIRMAGKPRIKLKSGVF